jgi:PGAP1-like protein
VAELSRYPAPHRTLLWSEQLRAGAETAAYFAALPALSVGPRGDGHRVLVLPGLMADDRSTAGLRHVLGVRGYRPHTWRLGTNIGPTRRIHDGLIARLAELSADGEQPVSLIGCSLGGILARELARYHPESVRTVITLGSPFRLTTRDSPDATHTGRIFHAFRPWHTEFLEHAEREEHRSALQVPATSIYSRLDGVVPWQACLDLPGPLRENVEVRASHLGLAVHPAVLAIVLDRLRQPVGAWRPFDTAAATA